VPITLVLDAAVEIERLRTALQKIRDVFDSPDIFDEPHAAGLDVIYDIVRAALTKDQP
jgi:hypothetical protein